MPGASLQGLDFVYVTFTTVRRHQLATASRVWRKVHLLIFGSADHCELCINSVTGHCAGLIYAQRSALGIDAEILRKRSLAWSVAEAPSCIQRDHFMAAIGLWHSS
jgi:hypothetical protein